jgi:hypothetical protein
MSQQDTSDSSKFSFSTEYSSGIATNCWMQKISSYSLFKDAYVETESFCSNNILYIWICWLHVEKILCFHWPLHK